MRCEVCANCTGIEVTEQWWLSCVTHGVHTDPQIKAQTPFSSRTCIFLWSTAINLAMNPQNGLQILQFVFRVLSTPTASQASSCRSVNTPEILFKAHPPVIQRANGCGRLQLAQLCLGFAWMLYLECWILLPAENQKHQQWSVPAPLRFVLCHICCAVGFFSNAGLYIQWALSSERINTPCPTLPWAPGAGLRHSSLKWSWDFFQSLCWFIVFSVLIFNLFTFLSLGNFIHVYNVSRCVYNVSGCVYNMSGCMYNISGCVYTVSGYVYHVSWLYSPRNLTSHT